jgi:hypothetical protein
MSEPPRRIIVCGSRNWRDRRLILDVLDEYMPEPFDADEPTIVHGGCRGADKLAADVALQLGFWVEEHPPQWRTKGKAAGPLRNRQMASLGADLCIAFGDGKGTRDMIAAAEAAGIPVRREGLDA